MESTANFRKRSPTFLEIASKRKASFIQFFAMTAVLMMSIRSAGQKYRIHGLSNDIHELSEEKESLSLRLNTIKDDLLHEARNDPSGLLMSHLKSLFSADEMN